MNTQLKKSPQKTTHFSYKCEDCADTGEIIYDTCDYKGEHVQNILLCTCTKLTSFL